MIGAGLWSSVFLFAQLVEPKPIDQDKLNAFIELFVIHNCSMTEQEAATIIPQSGFSKDETQNIAAVLVGDGLAIYENNKLTLLTPECK